MAGPRMNVSIDGDEAVLTLLEGSGATGAVRLNGAQLLELIRGLGSARAAMVAGKALPLDAQGVQAVVSPAWTVRPEALTEGSMMAFAHPAYGTVGFVLAAAEVERMVRALTVHLGMVHSSETEMSRN